MISHYCARMLVSPLLARTLPPMLLKPLDWHGRSKETKKGYAKIAALWWWEHSFITCNFIQPAKFEMGLQYTGLCLERVQTLGFCTMRYNFPKIIFFWAAFHEKIDEGEEKQRTKKCEEKLKQMWREQFKFISIIVIPNFKATNRAKISQVFLVHSLTSCNAARVFYWSENCIKTDVCFIYIRKLLSIYVLCLRIGSYRA